MTPKEKIDKYIKWYAAMRGMDEKVVRWTTQHEALNMDNPTERDYIAPTVIQLSSGQSRTLGPCAVLMKFSLAKSIDGITPAKLEEAFYLAVKGDATQYPLMEKMMYAVSFGAIPDVKGYMISQFAMGAGSGLYPYFKSPKVALATHWFIREHGLNYGFGKALSSFTPLELTVHYFQFFMRKNPQLKTHSAVIAELNKIGFSKDAEIYSELMTLYPKLADQVVNKDAPYLSNDDTALINYAIYPSIALMYQRKAAIMPLWKNCSQILVDCKENILQYNDKNLYGASPSLILSTRPEGCKIEEIRKAYPDINIKMSPDDIVTADPLIPSYTVDLGLDSQGRRKATSSPLLNADIERITNVVSFSKFKLSWNFFDIK